MKHSVFRRLDFSEALELSTTSGKLLVVAVSAKSSVSCQRMERDTWADDGVVRWISDDAIVIGIDVDREQELAQRFGIDELPTVIAFLNGGEVDRVVGVQTPQQLVAWLERFSLGVLRAKVAVNPSDMSVRSELARALVRAGHFEAAMTEQIWLWQHMLEHRPSAAGVRLSYVISDLERLVSRYPPARAAVTELRDQVTPPPDGEPDRATVVDWICLNRALGDSTPVLRWFDSVYKTIPKDQRWQRVVELWITPLLIANNRWADAGATYSDPRATLARMAQELATVDALLSMTDVGKMTRTRVHAAKMLRDTAGQLVRALRAAARIDDARAVVQEARRLDPSQDMAAALDSAAIALGD